MDSTRRLMTILALLTAAALAGCSSSGGGQRPDTGTGPDAVAPSDGQASPDVDAGQPADAAGEADVPGDVPAGRDTGATTPEGILVAVAVLPEEGRPIEVAWRRLPAGTALSYRVERAAGTTTGPFTVLDERAGDAPDATGHGAGVLTFEDAEAIPDTLLAYRVVARTPEGEVLSEVETAVRFTAPLLPPFGGQHTLVGTLVLSLEAGLPLATARERFRVTHGVRVTPASGRREDLLAGLAALGLTVRDPGGTLPLGVEVSDAGYAAELRALAALDGVAGLWLDRRPEIEAAGVYPGDADCEQIVTLVGADTYDFVNREMSVRILHVDTDRHDHAAAVGRTLRCVLTANNRNWFAEDPVLYVDVDRSGLYNAMVVAGLVGARVVNLSLAFSVYEPPLPSGLYGGLLTVYAAGNRHTRTWDGPFAAKEQADGTIVHDFAGLGGSPWASLVAADSGRGDFSTFVTWDRADVELGLRIRDIGGRVVASSEDAPGAGCRERPQLACVELSRSAWVAADVEVYVIDGDEDALADLNLVLGSQANLHPRTGRYAIISRNADAGALAVGGTRLPDAGGETIRDYSSTGPGLPDHLGVPTRKPDLVAPAVLNGEGTSNAAPIVAAAAALLWQGMEDGSGFGDSDPVEVVRARLVEATEFIDPHCAGCTGSHDETYGAGRLHLPEMVPVVGYAVADVEAPDGAGLDDVPSRYDVERFELAAPCADGAGVCPGLPPPFFDPYHNVILTSDGRPMYAHAFVWFEPKTARDGAPLVFEYLGVPYHADGVVQIPRPLLETLEIEPVVRWQLARFVDTEDCGTSPWFLGVGRDHCAVESEILVGPFPETWDALPFPDLTSFVSRHRATVGDSALRDPDVRTMGPVLHRSHELPVIPAAAFESPRVHPDANSCHEAEDIPARPTYPYRMDAALVLPEDGGLGPLAAGACPDDVDETGAAVRPARHRVPASVREEGEPPEEPGCFCVGGGRLIPCETEYCTIPCAPDC